MTDRGRYAATGIQAELEPGSRGRVLRNLRGIRLVREMHRAEFEGLLRATDAWIARTRTDHRFTADDLCWMHREWLGKIYPWAGEFRAVDLAKGDVRFANAAQIPRLMQELERGPLATFTPCRPAEVAEVANALAVVHAELILIHPFREGNGRAARLVAGLMGLQARLPALQFDALDGKGKPAYFAAIQKAFDRDYGPLSALFVSVIEKTLLRQRGRLRD
ncbi:MAG: Fic family protein [Thermoanaerobaculia bacterium]